MKKIYKDNGTATLVILCKELIDIWESYPVSDKYDDHENAVARTRSECADELRKLINCDAIKNTRGDIMPISEFIAKVEAGLFIDYDGVGHCAFEDFESDEPVYPSQVKSGTLNRAFSHVVWYNR